MAAAQVPMPFDLTDWDAFLPLVPGVNWDSDTSDAVKQFFLNCHMTQPINVETLTDKDLVEGKADVRWPKDRPLIKAAIRKVLLFVQDASTANHDALTIAAEIEKADKIAQGVVSAQRAAAPALPGANGAPQVGAGGAVGGTLAIQDQSQRLAMLGMDPSAISVATVLAGGSKVVDVGALLGGIKDQCNLSGYSYQLRADQIVFQLLQDHTTAAKARSARAFMYVDFTKPNMLPPYISVESVGGKQRLASEEFQLSGKAGDSLNVGSIHAAYRQAFQTPRWFRHTNQWVAVFWTKYVPVAIATEQLSLADCLHHFSNVLRLIEDLRQKRESVHLALLYEDRVRYSWARRAEALDTTLNISEAVKKLDKEVMADCKVRLASVLAEVGLSQGAGGGSSSARALQEATAETVLKRQQEAASMQTSRSEQAEKKMNLQAKALQDKVETLRAESTSGFISNNQFRKAQWEARIQGDREARGRARDRSRSRSWRRSRSRGRGGYHGGKGGGKHRGKGKSDRGRNDRGGDGYRGGGGRGGR